MRLKAGLPRHASSLKRRSPLAGGGSPRPRPTLGRPPARPRPSVRPPAPPAVPRSRPPWLARDFRGDLDLALEDLARRALRELVGEPDLARVLVVGHALLDVVAQLVRVDVLALLEHDRGADLLAHLVV